MCGVLACVITLNMPCTDAHALHMFEVKLTVHSNLQSMEFQGHEYDWLNSGLWQSGTEAIANYKHNIVQRCTSPVICCS